MWSLQAVQFRWVLILRCVVEREAGMIGRVGDFGATEKQLLVEMFRLECHTTH